MLIQPKVTQMRYPDEYSRPTALYTSYSYYDVVGNNGAGTAVGDLGKFSFLFRPVISGLVATFNGTDLPFGQEFNFLPTATWGPASFYTASNYNSSVDPNTIALCGVPNGTYTGYIPLGLMTAYRPLAMSVWCNFTGNTLQDGGRIAAALLDGSVTPSYFVNPPPVPGSMQEYENLAQAPTAYEGPLNKGSYSFWVPYADDDTLFYPYFGGQAIGGTADDAESHDWPVIAVSGISTQPGNIVARIEVVTVFEYTTNSRLVQVLPSDIAPNLILNARAVLAQKVCTSMANDEHKSFISEALGILGSAAKGAAKAAGPALLDVLLGML